jgi:hypothetical protein
VFGGCGDGQEGQGEHGQGDPPVPGCPVAHLVLVQPGQALAGLEILLGGPAQPGNLDQGGQRDRVRAVAAVERQFPGAPATADQQVPAARIAAGDGDPGPVVPALPLGACPADNRCQAWRGRRAASSSARAGRPAPAGTR